MSPPQAPVVIAIDGPAGAGKSTAARLLAERLGYLLLDTGALYRAVAYQAQAGGVDWADGAAVAAVARKLAGSDALRLVQTDSPGGRGTVLLAGRDVSEAIRSAEISMGASQVSAHPAVRQALLGLQRRLADGTSGHRGVVAEGRDMGTVVFPDAPVKLFLTASLQVRAERRANELHQRGKPTPLEQVRREVAARDRQDREREVAPLVRAEDATLLDSTDKSIAQVVAEMARVVNEALG